MDEQRKLRNLLAYTKTDTIEELEDCNKLYQELLDYINKQETLKKLPTADEVCKAYLDYFHCPLTYNKITKSFEEIKGGRARGRIFARLFIDKIDIPHKLPIHLLSMISRFYEGLEVKE